MWSHEGDESLVTLSIDGEIIIATAGHPFYTADGEWIAAGDLQIGAEVYSADGTHGTLDALVITDGTAWVYNLTVDEAHTYFVGDGQWLVHNCPPTGDGGDGLLDEIIKHIDNHGLPLSNGIRLNRQLTPDEMVLLTRRYNLEFGLGRERRITFGRDAEMHIEDGQFLLFSGDPKSSYGNMVHVPYSMGDIDIVNIYHTHLSRKHTPSGSDIRDLLARDSQNESGVIPNILPAQVYPYNRLTPGDDTDWNK